MEEREIHLRHYLKVIKKRRYILLTFFPIVMTLVVIYIFSATPLYTAVTKVLIEKNEANPLATGHYYSSYDPDFLETQYQIITSARVARKVTDILAVDKKYGHYFPTDSMGMLGSLTDLLSGGFTSMLEKIGLGGGATETGVGPDRAGDADRQRAEQIAEQIAAAIVIEPVKESRVVNVSFSSPNPTLSQLIVNTLAQAYMEEILEIKMSSSGYAIKWMTEKAQEEKTRLEKSETALQEYMKKSDIVTVEDRITVVPQKLAEVSTQLTQAEAKRKELEARYGQLRKVSASSPELDSMPAVAANATIQSIRGQILKAEQEIADLSKKYGPKHPAMIRAVDDLKVLEAKKKQEVMRVVESIGNEYELARSNEENLRSLLARNKDEALNVNEKFIQYGILKREVETNRLLYDALVTKMKEASATEQTQTVNVWVVERARTPIKPTKPNKKQDILIGLIVGLFGGLGLCFFVEYLDNTVKSPEDAEERFGLSVLGVIEKVRLKGGDIDQAVLKEPASQLAESYKGLRTALLLSAADKPPVSVLVTSLSPQEGKTTIAANLAVAVAQSELKVVLIDADLRKPRIHKVFGLPAAKGLSTYLAGASDMDILCTGPLANLTIIPAGPIPPNPSELLSSNRMKELIADLTARFDLVLIDSPPLLSITDSLILSRTVEGTIVVTEAGRTTYEFIEKGLKSLKDANARTLGLILNALDLKKSGYYYQYGYGNYNYYYTSDKTK